MNSLQPTTNIVKLERWLNVKQGKPTRKVSEERMSRILGKQVLHFVERFIEGTTELKKGEPLMGEILWLYFRADPETQNQFVADCAAFNHLEPPPLDWTPRQRVLQALYGNDPDDVAKPQVGDSRAGKRTTAQIRTYEVHAGLRPVHKRKKRVVEIVPRKTRDFLRKLFEATDEKEIKVLEAVIARAFGPKAVKLLPQHEAA